MWGKKTDTERRLAELRQQMNETNPLKDAPPPLPKIGTNQPWRQPTSNRYLESLKQKLAALESSLPDMHTELMKQHVKGRDHYPGFLAITGYTVAMVAYENAIEEAQALAQRIENIYQGEVRAEILELETRIEKTELLGDQNYFAKSELVDLRAGLKELKATGKLDKTEDEEKMDTYLQRRKLDHRHKIEEEIGAALRGREEVMMFKKRRRKEILENRALTEGEQEELLEALDQQCHQYLKGLNNEVQIYEED